MDIDYYSFIDKLFSILSEENPDLDYEIMKDELKQIILYVDKKKIAKVNLNYIYRKYMTGKMDLPECLAECAELLSIAGCASALHIRNIRE